MKYVICAIRDRAADAFGRPMFSAALGQAIRSFVDEVNRSDPNNQLAAHPDDFDLYQLGTFDDSTGMFDTGVPRQVAIGKDVAQKA